MPGDLRADEGIVAVAFQSDRRQQPRQSSIPLLKRLQRKDEGVRSGGFDEGIVTVIREEGHQAVKMPGDCIWRWRSIGGG